MKINITISVLLLSAFSFAQLNNEGWTILNPNNTSKIIYISSSEGNNNTGVIYDPADGVIGANPMQPIGNIMPFQTIEDAITNVNDGDDTWILLKRGDEFYEKLVVRSGNSLNRPIVYSSYGSDLVPPIIKTEGDQSAVDNGNEPTTHFWVIGLSFYSYTRDPSNDSFFEQKGGKGVALKAHPGDITENILFEGNTFRFFQNNVIQGNGTLRNINFRRNLFLDNYSHSVDGHSQGMFVRNVEDFLMEDNVFDHNGWYQQNFGDGGGGGYQGQATVFNHNTYFVNTRNVTFRNNSFYRPSSIGTKWTANDSQAATQNATVVNNFYYDCELGISMGGNDTSNTLRFLNSTISENVVCSSGLSRQTDRNLGWGIDITDWDGGTLDNNYIINQTSPLLVNGHGFEIRGVSRNVTIEKNIFYNLQNSTELLIDEPGFTNMIIRDNEITKPYVPQGRGRLFFNSANSLNGFILSNNIYSNAESLDEPFSIAGNESNYSNWESFSGETGSSSILPNYPDPTRNLYRYITEVLGLNSIEEYYEELRKQSYYNWRKEYSAEYINSWIKEGFSISDEPPIIVNTTLPNGEIGVLYSETLTAIGGNAPFTWSVTAGTLPDGLSLSSEGVLSGTPTMIQTETFTITVTNTNSEIDSQEFTINITEPDPCKDVSVNAGPDTVVSLGNSVILNASASESGTYSWSPTTSLDNPNSATPTASPTITTNYTVTFISDINNCEVIDQVTVRVAELEPNDILITTASLPDGEVGQTYSAQIATIGGSGGLNWEVDKGVLPNGLTLNNNGTITGTPTIPQTISFLIEVEDSNGNKDSQEFTIIITQPDFCDNLTVNAGNNITITEGESTILEAMSSDTGTYSWSPTNGLNNPGGPSTNANPTTTTTYTVTFTRNSDGCSTTDQVTVNVINLEPINITTTSLPEGQINQPYSVNLSAVGGDGNYSWELTQGALPNGLNLSIDGVISGIPTTVEITYFTITVTDNLGNNDSQEYSIINIIDPTLCSGVTVNAGDDEFITEGESVALNASSSNTGSYSWSPINGLNDPNSASPIASPTTTTTYTVVFTDDINGCVTTDPITVNVTNLDAIEITTSLLPEGQINQPFTASLVANGGDGNYSWSVSLGTLPNGLTLSSDGIISGTPTIIQSTTFTVTVEDCLGNNDSQEFTLEIIDPCENISVNAGSDINIVAGESTVLAASSLDDGNYSWFPETGLDNPSESETNANPTSTTTYTVTFTDSNGIYNAVDEVTITVTNLDPIEIVTTSLPDGETNQAYTFSLTAVGGNGSYSWEVTAGFLPTGLTLDTNGMISGTPTTGQFAFTVTVTDSIGNSDSQQFTLNIIDLCEGISVDAGTDTLINEGESTTLNAISSQSGTYSWLPITGLDDPNTATPIASPIITTTYTVTFINEDDCEVADELTITVNPIPEEKTNFGFSPNDDGINDFWRIVDIEDYPDNKVQIFNRWGNLVFEIRGYDNSSNYFNGNANKLTSLGARELPEGTYFFKITIPGNHSINKTEGFLILKR